MTQTDDKNVKIQGAIGKPPTETFKVSATYMDGFKATCVSIINGGQAGAKAHAVANAILDRSRAINKFMGMGDFEDTYVTAIGNEESFGKNASKVCCQLSCFTKGQLILKCLLMPSNLPINQQKNFQDFCPSL